jgi:hypothetical protein
MLSTILKRHAPLKAITYVGSATCTTSQTIDLTTIGLIQNDLVVTITAGMMSTYTPSGFTDLFSGPMGGYGQTRITHKVMSSTPDTVITVKNSSTVGAGLAIGFRGVYTSAPIANSYNTTDYSLDPPAHTVQAIGDLVIAVILGAQSTTFATEAPTGYSNVLGIRNSTSSYTDFVGAAYKRATATGSENPSTFASAAASYKRAITFTLNFE